MEGIRKVGSLVLLVVLWLSAFGSYGQSHEAKSLLLNMEKLSQLKNILRDMKEGYRAVSNGYRRVKDIAEGNFSLHEVFLDGLMVVSPAVKKYARVADVVHMQKALLSEYRAAIRSFNAANVFVPSELSYMAGVYENLFSMSLQNLEDLAMVITSSKLRMGDQERLAAIDRIFADMEDKLLFLREFNGQARVLMAQKQREQSELDRLRLYLR